MTLCDTGPLYSLIDARQQDHQRCRAIFPSLLPLLTTWPCFTEAMYFAGRSGGWRLRRLLWQYVLQGLVELREHSESEHERMRDLMLLYRKVPMALADASLVVLAEKTGLRRIFTLDSDFRIYRTADGGTFDIVPE